jgi:hypothetical protein
VGEWEIARRVERSSYFNNTCHGLARGYLPCIERRVICREETERDPGARDRERDGGWDRAVADQEVEVSDREGEVAEGEAVAGEAAAVVVVEDGVSVCAPSAVLSFRTAPANRVRRRSARSAGHPW